MRRLAIVVAVLGVLGCSAETGTNGKSRAEVSADGAAADVQEATESPDVPGAGDVESLAEDVGGVPDVAVDVEAPDVAACVPWCQEQERECGQDGCGGVCGYCGSGESCTIGKCTNTCTPNCKNRECGADGCGGVCGYCPSGGCVSGKCPCLPDCSGKACGDDGCGGQCGECPATHTCTGDGSCYCKTDCYEKACGAPNGCGGICGSVAAICESPSATCKDGVCEEGCQSDEDCPFLTGCGPGGICYCQIPECFGPECGQCTTYGECLKTGEFASECDLLGYPEVVCGALCDCLKTTCGKDVCAQDVGIRIACESKAKKEANQSDWACNSAACDLAIHGEAACGALCP